MEENRVYSYMNGTVTLGLCLTEDCNFDCSYCNVVKTKHQVSYEHVIMALTYFFGFYKNVSTYHIVFQGGETLLVPKLLKKSILLIRRIEKEIGKKILISIPLNGSLLTENWLRFFLLEKVNISLSLDTLDIVRDVRFIKNSGSSVPIVQTKLPLYLKYHLMNPKQFRISSVVVPENISYYTEFALSLIEMGFRSLYLQPVHGVYWSDQDIRKYLMLKRSVSRLFQKLGIDSNAVGYVEGLRKKKGCGKGIAEMCIDTYGNILVCNAFLAYRPEDRKRFAFDQLYDQAFQKDFFERLASWKFCTNTIFPYAKKLVHCKSCDERKACSTLCYSIPINGKEMDMRILYSNFKLGYILDYGL